MVAKRLFCIRLHPTSAPPSIVALLATSASEAERLARGATGLATEQAYVFEVGEDSHLIVTFPPTDKAGHLFGRALE